MNLLLLLLLTVFFTGFSLVLGLFPLEWDTRPRLKPLGFEAVFPEKKRKLGFLKYVALINRPVVSGFLRRRIIKDLAMGHVSITPEEFFLWKEIMMIFLLLITLPILDTEIVLIWFLFGVCIGYMLPEFWLKSRVRKIRLAIVKELPDAIDLLALCVNAGLDFMLALKWVVEKSPQTIMMSELNFILQEISVGKTRRDALRDFAGRYDIPDLGSFSRTLIQADKMGTSVSEALNILSEDMRASRFRRGEQFALKAPLKMLVPLMFFILPVVMILVAMPIFVQFVENNPFKSQGF